MITAGIDVGIESLKTVILKDEEVVARGLGLSGGADRGKSVEQVWNEALATAGLSPSDVSRVIATGQGKFDVPFAQDRIVEPVADARAARFLYPPATSMVDIGADQVRLVILGPQYSILEVVMNQKCAAGLGIFLRTIARTLGMTLDEMSSIVSDAHADITVHDGCAVFTELDALGLLNRNIPSKPRKRFNRSGRRCEQEYGSDKCVKKTIRD